MKFGVVDELDITDPIGGLWLAQRYGLSLYSPVYTVSDIGKSRMTVKNGDYTRQIYKAHIRPDDSMIAHLAFHLKHEVLSFELLARLFAKVCGDEIADWVASEPTGVYARRAAFLYEWITGKEISVPSNIGGNYVDVLDDGQFITASQPTKDSRWRVNNNIAGSPHFSPVVVKTEPLKTALALNVADRLSVLNDEFGEDLVMRSSVWITLRESRASFIIEGEGKHLDRIERFAHVLASQVGQGELPLSHDTLAVLQKEIIGHSLSIRQYGLRQSPVFVGETNYREQQEIVHYIAPPADRVTDKLQGLSGFIKSTTGQSSVMRSAVAAFSFVYIHPLADGNGRLHRLLINDILRRDGQTANPVILPISKAIIEDGASRKAYNEVLDAVSKPVMAALSNSYHFGKAEQYPDGIRSNLVLDDVSDALPLWRFMDLTSHVVYLAGLIDKVISEDMPEESRYLRRYDAIREAVKNVIEMSNLDADRIIRSILDNKGVRSNKLTKEYVLLADDKLWQQLVAAVVSVIGEGFVV